MDLQLHVARAVHHPGVVVLVNLVQFLKGLGDQLAVNHHHNRLHLAFLDCLF